MSSTNGSWEAPEIFNVPDQTRYDRNGNHDVVDKRGLFVLHSVLLRTGKVLMFCGHVESADYGGNPDGAVSAGFRGVSYVFDPEEPSLEMKPKYFPTGLDLFCCHYVQIPDGRILVVGGSLDMHMNMNRSLGAKNICFFDPNIEEWKLSKTGSSDNRLAQGRWYPTAVLLGSGKVAVFSGRNEGLPETTNSGDPLFRDNDGVELTVPTASGKPIYTDAGGNVLSLSINNVGLPYYIENANTSLAVVYFLVWDFLAAKYYFYTEAGTIVYNATITAGVPTFTAAAPPVDLIDLTWITQRLFDISDKCEILSPPDYAAEELIGGTFKLPIYPGMHLAPDGKIYFSGTNWGQEIPNPNTMAITIDSATNTGVWEDFGPLKSPNSLNREEGMSVLLPPAQDGKILLFGGTLALTNLGDPLMEVGNTNLFGFINDSNDTISAEVCDTSSGSPVWTDTVAKLKNGRVNGHGVILPDETVLIAGGHDNYKWLPNTGNTFPNCQFPTGEPLAVKTEPSAECEIFDGTNFIPAASLTHPRMYHSTCLLLPDGRVMISGGADPNDKEPPLFTNASGQAEDYPIGWNAPRYYRLCRDGSGNPILDGGNPTYQAIPLNRKDYEIYKPPYFFKGDRPTINDNGITRSRGGEATSQVYYEQQFYISTPDANDITKVAFMRPGAPTHHTDSEQRYVKLEFIKVSDTELEVTLPSNRNLAPPGYYMVWIMKNATTPETGLVPCDKAVFIQLAEAPPAPPIIPNDKKCIIATTATGSEHHQMVVYLQQLRTNIINSSASGSTFIQLVNRLYYFFSPAMAHTLSKDERAKINVRDFVVVPTVRIIQTAEKFVKEYFSKKWRNETLIAALSIIAISGIIFLPMLILFTGQALFNRKINRHVRK